MMKYRQLRAKSAKNMDVIGTCPPKRCYGEPSHHKYYEQDCESSSDSCDSSFDVPYKIDLYKPKGCPVSGKSYGKCPESYGKPCGKSYGKCNVDCSDLEEQVNRQLCKEDLMKYAEHCKDVETCVEHKFCVQPGKHKVKKTITYNHIVSADVVHHVKENVECRHKYEKEVHHKDVCKVVDGNDCKEKCDKPYVPKRKKHCKKSCSKSRSKSYHKSHHKSYKKHKSHHVSDSCSSSTLTVPSKYRRHH